VIVAFDATLLVYVVDENAPAPIDPGTGKPVTDCKQRIEYLLETLQKDDAKIVIPTPALGEVLVKAQQMAPELLRQLNSSKHFRIAPFDTMAAVEYSSMHAQRLGKAATNRTKAKFDEQIVAISRVENVQVIYSDDGDIAKLANPKIKVMGIAELPLPPVKAQSDMFDPAYSQDPNFGKWG
jgi:predicted nucleic acid-binding protein